MAESRRVFSDARKGSPSGCKNSIARLTTGSRATWALENEDAQQNNHGLFQRRYVWNEKNLLKESSDSRYTVYYRYGADGQRALKSSSQSETLYFNSMWSWIHNSSAYNTDREIKHIYLGSERLVTRTNAAGSDGHTSTGRTVQYTYDEYRNVSKIEEIVNNDENSVLYAKVAYARPNDSSTYKIYRLYKFGLILFF